MSHPCWSCGRPHTGYVWFRGSAAQYGPRSSVAEIERATVAGCVSETAGDSRPGMQSYTFKRTVSHHFLRRRARAAWAKLKPTEPDGVHYMVRKTKRGPWRWRVEEWRQWGPDA